MLCVRGARKLGEWGSEVRHAIREDFQVSFSVNDDTNDQEGNMKRGTDQQGKVI